jgi:hypothetical protein
VGYGDISGKNNIEMMFCAVVMVIGVIGFSYATGTLSSIIQNFDAQDVQQKQKLVVLNRVYQEFQLPLDLYLKLKQQIFISEE